METFIHKPVLLEQCIYALAIRPDGVYLDGTLGRAGHSFEIAKRLTDGGSLICVDRDEAALVEGREKLAQFSNRVHFCHGNFADVGAHLSSCGFEKADGMLFDLGVSSPQLDNPARGFSYMHDAPLDMRMDQTQELTAYDVINGWSREALRKIFFQFGEERYAPLIAAAIERTRQEREIKTTLELVEIIKGAMPAKALREKQHPAKRVFQAIRIAVNGELDAVERVIKNATNCLNPGGRLAVITFHSLEDRIVKNGFRQGATGCTCPPDFPVCVCGKTPELEIITKKPILPTEDEVQENPRARSAKLRVAMRR